MRHIEQLFAVIVWTLLVIGCGNDAGPSRNDVACSLASIAISPTSSTIAVGGTQHFDLQGTCSNGDFVPSLSSLDGQLVVWSSSNPNVAVVDTGGNARGVAIGSAVIQAELGTWTATAVLTVNTGRTLQVVVIEPTLATVLSGATKQLHAIGRYSDGTDTDLTDTASWSSDDAAIATVDGHGKATGVTRGSTIVRAVVDGKEGVAALEVIDAAIESLEVAPPSPTFARTKE